ncbi:hypothetical protein SDC9_58685 [bioreactor metagenome]|uniref:Uncharacterized protein n=1 Tax=bioreactor metagenome TaxID=1076179 RepID=A0A644X849_9ZZZZ
MNHSLLEDAPALVFPNNGCPRPCRSVDQRQYRLKHDGVDLAAAVGNQLRHDRVIYAVAYGQRDDNRNHRSDGQPDRCAEQTSEQHFFQHIIFPLYTKYLFDFCDVPP